jgi:hypothetical protein
MTDPGPPAAPPQRRHGSDDGGARSNSWLSACWSLCWWLAVRLRPGVGPARVTLADLHGVGDLQARFNADRGQPRLMMIFSPT